MTIPNPSSSTGLGLRNRVLGSTRLVILLVLLLLLLVCLVAAWMTRDAMGNLSFLKPASSASRVGKKTIVDKRPSQRAQALAPLAKTAEEIEYARDAERLADHEVDQAFAAALRQAALDAEHITLTGEALALSQKVSQLQQLIVQDNAQVQTITAQLNSPDNKATRSGPPAVDQGDLDVAKAQLGL